jgi:CD109 antigen
MLNFVPNIVVMDYLTTLNKLTPEIESKAKKYMESGYQRELTYKHDDGSYSAFGKSDKSGSTWLTAFVAKSFMSAAKYILVDRKNVEESLDFLANVQLENGSFPEVGHVSHKDMQGGSSNGIALTAYTLTTFLGDREASEKYKNTIDKALKFIVENIDSLDDKYSIAITSYALQLAKHELKNSLLAKLESKAENKNGQTYWTKEIPTSDKENPWYSRPSSVNVEMTAYALNALLETGRVSSAVPIMKWLVAQRNENGGFVSTQDTVVGLQALSKMAMNIYSAKSQVDISLVHSNGRVTNLNINEQNALILQKHEIPSNAREFHVTAKGNGFSILQMSYRYNVNETGEWPRFTIEPKVHENSNKEFLHLIVCTSFVPDDTADKSNMAVMEVSLPSGFTFDTDSLDELKRTEKVKVRKLHDISDKKGK